MKIGYFHVKRVSMKLQCMCVCVTYDEQNDFEASENSVNWNRKNQADNSNLP